MLKYTGKYWMILAPLARKSLKKHYGKTFADQTMAKAKTEYRAMLERVPAPSWSAVWTGNSSSAPTRSSAP